MEQTTSIIHVSYTPGAIGSVTKRTGNKGQGLEPDAGKLSCPVLRGLEGGNTFRLPGDLDIFVNPDATNAQRILTALEAFGFASVGLTPSDFERPDQVVQLGVPPVRIDLITSITGVSWDEAWAGRVAGRYGDIPVSYIGREHFIANKRATGRAKDVADLEMLGEA